MSSGRNPAFPTLAAFISWLDQAPASTLLTADEVRLTLSGFSSVAGNVPDVSDREGGAAEASWRERLWTCAPTTRLDVREAAEALNRPTSYVYRHTSTKSGLAPIPHRKLDGELVFLAGELRAWMERHEETVIAAPVSAPRQLRAS